VITKAELLERATAQELRPTTVEKDYVLGWMLAAISHHPRLSQWVFKGGTCLKKCYFETYRFSEDLDFTIPSEVTLSPEGIKGDLAEAGAWVSERSGISFPPVKIKVEKYTNLRGRESYQAKAAYACRLNLAPNSLQRIKFDITQDEFLVDTPDQRAVSHPYADAQEPEPTVRCYSIDEILAEKTRALFERQGRARDVYDLVHLSHGFRDSIDPVNASAILQKKFAFKELPAPTVELIVDRIQEGPLRANWNNQLAHQLPKLPPIEGFLADLPDAIAWWFAPDESRQPLSKITLNAGEAAIPRQHFPAPLTVAQRPAPVRRTPEIELLVASEGLDRIRYAARNRLCAEVEYEGVTRLIEPYSLRRSANGDTLLYAFEQLKDGSPTGQLKSYDLTQIKIATLTDHPFSPRHPVEL